jgi:hypothetical protein
MTLDPTYRPPSLQPVSDSCELKALARSFSQLQLQANLFVSQLFDDILPLP